MYSAICETGENFTSAVLVALPNKLVPRDEEGMAQPVALEPWGGFVRVTAYPVARSRDQIMVLRAGVQPKKPTLDLFPDSVGLSQEALEKRYRAELALMGGKVLNRTVSKNGTISLDCEIP